MKQRILRLVRNIGISVGVLLLVALGAGVGYTWYEGQGASSTASATPAQPVAVAAPQPAKLPMPAANAPASVSIQQLTSPVSPGGAIDLIVRSNPTATCKVAVQYANKQPAENPALAAKATDDFGMAEWQWTLDASAPKGTGTVTVTCALDAKRSAMVQGDLDIT